MELPMTFFLDANIIIYRVEAVEPFNSHALATLKELVMQHPDSGFAVSRLSVMECLVKPLREQNSTNIARYRAFFSSAGLRIIEINAPVIEAATSIRVQHGLRTPDAIQAASALSLSGPVIFLTGDKQFCKVNGLNVKLVTTNIGAPPS